MLGYATPSTPHANYPFGKRGKPAQALSGAEESKGQVAYASLFRDKYKTEICRNWEITGNCEFFESCSFAHGFSELQKKPTPQNYKTKLCKQFHENLYCPYGLRCQFLHSETKPDTTKSTPNYQQKLKQNIEMVKTKMETPKQTTVVPPHP